MNYKKLTAFLCACCITGGIVYNNSFGGNVAVEVNAESSNTLTFTAIGQKNQILIKNTTEVPTWYSDNELVATVDSEGIVTAVAEGTANVYAVFSNQVLQFNIVVEVDEESTTEGEEQTDFNVGSVSLTTENPIAELSLGGIDASSAVWTSTDTSVAVVDENGKVTAVGSGTCQIIAAVDGKNYIVDVTSTYVPQENITEVVVGNLSLSNDRRAAKITLTFEDGGTIEWSSTDTSVATVDSEGIVTAQSTGTCRIIALHNGISYITEVTSTYIPPEDITEVVLGEVSLSNDNPVAQITLSGVPEGTAIEWSSTDKNVAAVDEKGIITAAGIGECQIIALINGVSYITEVTSTFNPKLTAEITADSTEITGIGNTLQLNVANTSDTPKWTSTNINVCTVDENGLVTATGEGTAEILAVLSNQVLKITVTVKAGETAFGDANCDGQVLVNDAVLVMAYITNSEASTISSQGLDNADVYQRGDGVGITDATSIQKYLTKLIKELPESYY